LSAPSSGKPSAFVLRLIKETSSHDQVKQEVKLWFCLFWSLFLDIERGDERC